MRASKVASVAALLGGISWLAHGGLVAVLGLDMTLAGPVGISFYVGAVLLGVAALAAGYTTVATAPVWLRVVVSLASMTLGAILIATIESGVRSVYGGTGWLHDVIGILVCAVLAMIGSWIGFARARNHEYEEPPPRRGGHRAAR